MKTDKELKYAVGLKCSSNKCNISFKEDPGPTYDWLWTTGIKSFKAF